MKTAVVHDWLVVYGGAERVTEQILQMYPDADVFTLVDHLPEHQRHFLGNHRVHTSFMQRLPGSAKHYRKMLPLMPYAIEQLDLRDYDLVISSSYCVAKGAMTGPNQVHVSYCHSPMRYAWDLYHDYLDSFGLKTGLKGMFARWQLHKIRSWDVCSSNGVDQFVANSRFVQRRISKYYGRSSELVYPPVDTRLFSVEENKDNYYVAAGRFVPYKCLDLVVKAFGSMPDKRLVLLGDGPEMARLKAMATPNVEFTGFQSPQVVRQYLSRARAFIFPSEEDFGIVPVEAQATGTPVLAYARGGALETVVPPGHTGHQATGLFFHEQTAAAIADAVQRFESVAQGWDPHAIASHAADFGVDAFRARFGRVVDESVKTWGAPWIQKSQEGFSS